MAALKVLRETPLLCACGHRLSSQRLNAASGAELRGLRHEQHVPAHTQPIANANP